ncbi:MAG: aspartate/glutamate racemase family protein [Nitrososphaerota archaeon]
MNIGLIRVVTLYDEKALNAHGSLIMKHYPEFNVISKCINDQPLGIYDEESKKKAIPKIIDLAKNFEKEKVKAIIISCADDPAVKEIREFSKIPIIGAGSASATLALALGEKIGIIGISEEPPKIFQKILKDYLVAYVKPKEVFTTYDIKKNVDEVIYLATKISKSIDVLTFACTGFSANMDLLSLSKKINKIVVDPVLASAHHAYYLLKNSMSI